MRTATTIFDNYVADFETTTKSNLLKDGCVRVWLWSLVNIGDESTYTGTNIETFLQTIHKLKCKRVYFHNLKFDGKFIVDYLIRNGYTYGKDYTVLIDGLNSWYEIKLIKSKNTIRIWDSAKKYPGTSVKQLGKLVGLPKLDKPEFDRYYPPDYQPTQQEIEYCIRDSLVVARALRIDLDMGLKSMTMASDCFNWGKDYCLGGKAYRDWFPKLGTLTDEFIRNSYRGGVTYLKPEYINIELENIKVYDVNSLYPSVMAYCPLPYGYPKLCNERPKEGLYVMSGEFTLELKDNHFPFLQVKHNPMFASNEFITEIDEPTMLYLTNVDYELLVQNYHIYYEKDYDFLSFDSMVGLMRPHIDYWVSKKIEYENEGLDFMRYKAKTMMNGFYGKTGSRVKRLNKLPDLDDDGNVTYSRTETTESDPIYIPYATFVTAWARHKLVNSALNNWDDFIYCDTDSIHMFKNDDVKLDIDKYELGKWKDETASQPNGVFDYGRYIKQKTYCHAVKVKCGDYWYKDICDIKAAGLSADSRTGIPIEDFKFGLKIKDGNKKIRTVPGGALIETYDWELYDYIGNEDAEYGMDKIMGLV